MLFLCFSSFCETQNMMFWRKLRSKHCMDPNDFHCMDQNKPQILPKYFLLCSTEESKSYMFVYSVFNIHYCTLLEWIRLSNTLINRTVEQNVFDYGYYWCEALGQCCKRIWSEAWTGGGWLTGPIGSLRFFHSVFFCCGRSVSRSRSNRRGTWRRATSEAKPYRTDPS